MSKIKIKFAKIKTNAVIPSKKDEDAGYDIYSCFEDDYIIINAHETKMIPTGIASYCSDDYSFIVKERGSTGSKGLGIRAGVIDSSYRGEWFIAVTNHNEEPYVIIKDFVDKNGFSEGTKFYPYEKAIAQFIIVPVFKTNIKEISYDVLKDIPSERGMGKLGDSGK